jgi:hypothetical protein
VRKKPGNCTTHNSSSNNDHIISLFHIDALLDLFNKKFCDRRLIETLKKCDKTKKPFETNKELSRKAFSYSPSLILFDLI